MKRKVLLALVALSSILYINEVKAEVLSDENLNKCVVDKYNADNDTDVSYETGLTFEQLSTIEELDCSSKNIMSAEDISYLSSLTSLDLSNNKLTAIDVSFNLSLENLIVKNNPIVVLDLRYNNQLKNFEVDKDVIVITDDKDLEEDMSSYDTDWKNLVLAFKERMGSEIYYIISTPNSLKVTDGQYITSFTYENGIVKYIPSSDSEKVMVFNGSIIIHLLEEYFEIKGIDNSEDYVQDLLFSNDEDSPCTFEMQTTLSGNKFSMFELDIKSDIQYLGGGDSGEPNSESGSNEIVKNPDTGIYYAYGVLGFVAVSAIIIYLYERKHSKFPQA